MQRLIQQLVFGVGMAVAAGGVQARDQAQDHYVGACDASAAVAIGQGHFVVGDDENDVLRVYRRASAEPVAEVDLTDYLRNRKPGGKPTEADIEGAATIGERIYWISSHARKGKDGEVDRYRQRLFATDIVRGAGVPTLRPVAAAPHETLLDELVADARFKVLADAARLKPEVEGGLNIEGLAATPEGALLVGLRNPLPQGRALVVPLRNPREVIDAGARPVFGELIWLDLGGRGIRSLERVGNAYLIVAGPYGEASASPVRPSFALFRWSGSAGQVPVLVPGLDAGSFRPEALFLDPDAGDLYLLSDDGDEQVGQRACKDKQVKPAKKSFRAMALPLPR